MTVKKKVEGMKEKMEEVIANDTISLEELGIVWELLHSEWISSRCKDEECDGDEYTTSYEEGEKMLEIADKLDRIQDTFRRYHIKDGIQLVR